MKVRMTTLVTSALVALTSVFPFVQSTSALSDCRKAEGNLTVVNNGNGTTSGTITNGNKLNGTTQTIFTSAFTATPDPNTFSYSDGFTVTTNHVVIKTHNLGIFIAAAGLFSEIARIDPNVSTGDFAGATGVLNINGKTTDGGATFKRKLQAKSALEAKILIQKVGL